MADEDVLKDYDDEMEKIFTDITTRINELKPKKGKSKFTEAERGSKISYLQSRLNRCKQVLRSYKVDLRSLDKSVALPYENKATEYKKKIEELIQELNWVQEAELMGGATVGGKKNLDAMTADEVLELAKKTQQKSLDSLDTTLQTIEQSKEVATATAQKLHEQSKQLTDIDETVGEIQTNLQMASKELRSFARRIATDKLIMGFMFLIVFGIIFIIVWQIVKGKKKDPVTSAVTPT